MIFCGGPLLRHPGISAFHNDLAIVLKRLGHLDESIAASRRAIGIQPANFEAYNSLGNCLREQRKLPEAVAAYRQAISIQPQAAEVYRNLGIALQEQREFEQATEALRHAVKLRPQFAAAHCDLAKALRDQGLLEEAIRSYRRAIELHPKDPVAYCHLGNVLTEQEQYEQALVMYDRALALDPQYADAYYNRGMALGELGRFNDAITTYEKALLLRPGHVESHYNLGNELRRAGRIAEAISSYQRALAIQPNYVEVFNNLGSILHDHGQAAEAIAYFRQAVKYFPAYQPADDNILYCLTFDPAADWQMLLAEGKRWNDQHAAPMKGQIRPHANDRDPQRRLRIGVVSPDLREHPVGRFMLSLFQCHNLAAVEMFCYSDARFADAMSDQLKSATQHWRDTRKWSDEKLAQSIREDRIDILLDLSLHMSKNRLQVFARKPAPVQATFAGYPGSTGVETIDYRLTDPYLDPPGVGDEFYSEKSIRLPDTFWCNHRMEEYPAVQQAPVVENKFITFGSLNNFCKVNDSILTTWTEVLRQVSNSHLLLFAPDEEARRLALERFDRAGIEPSRIEFVAMQPRLKYLQTYHRIDVGLDTWPYNGHATSFDSFAMGVPVVTLTGPTVVGRAGVSQLTNLGLTELIGNTPEEFIKIAVGLANDVPRLTQIRSELRARMERSPLTDGQRFARGVEAAYRSMWKAWCAA